MQASGRCDAACLGEPVAQGHGSSHGPRTPISDVVCGRELQLTSTSPPDYLYTIVGPLRASNHQKKVKTILKQRSRERGHLILLVVYGLVLVDPIGGRSLFFYEKTHHECPQRPNFLRLAPKRRSQKSSNIHNIHKPRRVCALRTDLQLYVSVRGR